MFKKAKIGEPKVRTGDRYDIRIKGRLCGLIFAYLLMLIIDIKKHLSTCECACDNERGVP